MILDPEQITSREKLILTGLYLSKYGRSGLKMLGFRSFTEAYNVVGYALSSRPAAIKNYRDEFDPIFPNARKGWHKRELRSHLRKILQDYGDLDVESYSGLIKSFSGYNEDAWGGVEADDKGERQDSGFAKRIMTGVAAERYFESVHSTVPEFSGFSIENRTQLGCGYDFKLSRADDASFLAIEVKGMREQAGSVSLTPKEFEVATRLRERFFLFVVKNFQHSPFHEIFPDPLAGRLQFTKTERVLVQVSWLTRI